MFALYSPSIKCAQTLAMLNLRSVSCRDLAATNAAVIVGIGS
jgi:hypothetical protein